MALKRQIRQYIECELRDYDQTKKEWENIQKNVICAGGCGDDSGIRGTDKRSATESKALRLISNKRLAQLERTIAAFERVLSRLQEEKYKLVMLKYWSSPQMLTDDGIALKLNISKRTLYDWQSAIILAFAKELGLVD